MLAAVIAHVGTVPDLSGRVMLELSVKEVLAVEHNGPRAWIVEPRGTTDRNETIGATMQRRTQRFVLLTLVTGAAGVSAGDLVEASETLRRGCWDRLIGWIP